MSQDNRKLPGTVENYWINSNASSNGCYRHKQLVYVSTLKNASTHYTHVFETNHWRQINFSEINWGEDYVFGFIQDPVTRYCKGLTEDICMTPELKDSILFMLDQISTDVVPLTFHSLPLSLTYGDRIYDIHWIALDDNDSGQSQVNRICNQHNVTIVWPQQGRLHQSTPDKLKVFYDVKQRLGNGNKNFWNLLSKDIDLYTNVITNATR